MAQSSSPAKPALRVAWTTHQAARFAVEHYHYSAVLPTPPLLPIGAWEDEAFIGAVIYSRGAASNIGKPFGLSQQEVCELTRVALTTHHAPVTQILADSVRLLRASNPGLRLIVSYADPNQGHHGGIYQAANWLYLGQGKPLKRYRSKDGRLWHSRMISASGWQKVYGEYRPVHRFRDCEAIVEEGKHKYVLPLDRGMRRQILPLAQEYPGRVVSA